MISLHVHVYDAPLAQRASSFKLHSSLFGPDGTINYDYDVTNSINSLLIGTCIPNGTYTNYCWAILALASKGTCIKNSDTYKSGCFNIF